MNDKTYNGWSNYETWAVKLWLDNAQGTAEDMEALARSNNGDEYRMSQAVKSYVEDMMPDLGASMFADLLNASLSEVDWYEIAESYLEDYDEEEEEEGGDNES